MSVLDVVKVKNLVTKFKRIHGNDRLKIIQSLDEVIGSDLRKPDGRLKSGVSKVLKKNNLKPVSNKISGSISKTEWTPELRIKQRKLQEKNLKSKRDRIDAGEKLAPEEMDYQTKIYFYMTPKQRIARRMTDKAFQDRRAKIAKALDIPQTDLERNATIAQHMDWMRTDKALGKNTPIKDLQAMYGKPGVTYDDVMINKYNLQEALIEGSPDSIVDLLYSQGVRGGQLASSVGHGMPINEAIKIKNKIAPWMTDVEFVQMINNPKSIRSELNLLNTQKRPTERMTWQPDFGWEKKSLKEMDEIYKNAQVRGQFFTPEGELTSIGMQGYDVDPQRLKWWINKIIKDDPFKGGKKLRLLPDKKILGSMYNLPNYSSGGLVKLLNRLKLTKKQRDLIMKTAYSPNRKPSTGPKALREKRIKDKLAKVGATKKWGYVKSDDIKPRKKRIKQRPFAAGGIVSHYV
jgi:hypothetical protein